MIPARDQGADQFAGDADPPAVLLALHRLQALPSSPERVVEPSNYKSYCKRLPYLVKRQQEICDLDFNVLQTISRGARLGVDECQHQFLMSRWNCSAGNDSSFGGVLSSRELQSSRLHSTPILTCDATS